MAVLLVFIRGAFRVNDWGPSDLPLFALRVAGIPLFICGLQILHPYSRKQIPLGFDLLELAGLHKCNLDRNFGRLLALIVEYETPATFYDLLDSESFSPNRIVHKYVLVKARHFYQFIHGVNL